MNRKRQGLIYFLLVLFVFIPLTTAHAKLKNLTKLSGQIEVLVFDYFKQSYSETKAYLSFENKFNERERVELTFKQKDYPSSGSEVTVECLMDESANEEGEKRCAVQNWQLLSLKEAQSIIRKSLWLIVNYSDVQNGVTPEYIKGKMDLNRNWFVKATTGQVDFPLDNNQDGQPDLYTVTIPYVKSDGCDPSKLQQQSLDAAKALGINISLYQHYVLILPTTSACRWSGLGHVGCGVSCTVWINSPGWELVYPHELGHNLGMSHASSDPSDTGNVVGEYNDPSCPMGNILSRGNFNAPHMVQMKWLDSTKGQIKTISSAGNYLLSALSNDIKDNQLQTLIMPKNATSNYFFSYRPGTSFDQVQGALKTGLNIYSQPGGGGNTRYVKTLKENETFLVGDYVISSSVKDAENLNVYVTSAGCISSTKITMDKNISTLYPNAPASFQISITNNTKDGCAPINVFLKPKEISGLSFDISENNFTLGSGLTKNVIIKVATTLTSGEFDGRFDVQVLQESKTVVTPLNVIFQVQNYPAKYVPGVRENLYLGNWDILPDFSLLPLSTTRIVPSVGVSSYGGKDSFGLSFRGYIFLEKGNYTFSLGSDDGSKLWLNLSLLIDNDGLHGYVEKSGIFTSDTPNYYPLRVEFFERGGAETLNLYYSKDGGPKILVPAAALFNLSTYKPTPLVINAGADQTIFKLPTSLARLRGSVISFDGKVQSILWKKISGPDVTILNPDRLDTLLDKINVGTYLFQLVVTDSFGQTTQDDVAVTVLDGATNVPPTVFAGNDITVQKGVTVNLVGTAFDDSGLKEVKWKGISGSSGLSNNKATYPKNMKLSYTFTADTIGVYEMEFSATDAFGFYSSDRVIITVK